MSDRRNCVFVAVPVYRGHDLVDETLRSILGQTHDDLRILISVDGNDRQSADACAPHLSDDRVEMVVQNEQLGWVDNLNWLIDACDGDFYCYWQQDDVCAPDYLEELVAALNARPDAACAYSDLRWFGHSSHEVVLPTIAGSTKERILTQIEAQSWLPLRALVPTDVLRRVGPVEGLDTSGHSADKLWSLRLAAAGDMLRVPRVLYFKREHPGSLSHQSRNRLTAGLGSRDHWLALGVELVAVAEPYFDPAERGDLITAIGERLVVPRPGRSMRYDPTAARDVRAFLTELFTAVETRWGVAPPLRIPTGATVDGLESLREQRRRAPEDSPLRTLVDEVLVEAERPVLVERALDEGSLQLDCSAAGQSRIALLEGWAAPEPWGTWSIGNRARIWLPVPDDGERWKIVLTGRLFVGTPDAPHRQRIIVRHGSVAVLHHETMAEEDPIPAFELLGATRGGDGITLDLELPLATSPADLGISTDQRRLSAAISSLELTRLPTTPPRRRMRWGRS